MLHVGIRENSVIDLAVKRALEKPVNKRMAVPYSDFKVPSNIIIIIITTIIINLIYIAQFDTNGIFTALYIVITYIQMQYVDV